MASIYGDISSINWELPIEKVFAQLNALRRENILRLIEKIDSVSEQLDRDDIFNHVEFRKIRSEIGSQQDWAVLVGVSQATIGNYERNKTYPNKDTRKSILNALRVFREDQVKLHGTIKGANSIDDFGLDVKQAKDVLQDSILDASLTDFEFDAKRQVVVPVPFQTDVRDSELEAIQQDRRDLMEALASQAASLAIELGQGANASLGRVVNALKEYSDQTKKERPNPRFLYRWGNTISRAASTDDVVFAISEFDKLSLDGFVDDHRELMRLYYREALARAQQVEAIEVDDELAIELGAEFADVADVLESAKTADGDKVFSDAIPTLLRDISSEIQEYAEAEILTNDDDRRKIMRRRRVEAIKNGSILVGRILIFASFVIVVDPMVALTTAGSIASIVGIIQNESPGTVRRYYEKMRAVMPFLPKFPGRK